MTIVCHINRIQDLIRWSRQLFDLLTHERFVVGVIDWLVSWAFQQQRVCSHRLPVDVPLPLPNEQTTLVVGKMKAMISL